MTDATESSGPRWRLIVGVLGLVYGIGGAILWTLAIVMSLLWKQLMSLGGMGNIEMPPAMYWNGLVSSVLLLGLGVLLAIGSALLLARRPRGAKLMLTWVVLRVVLLVVGLGIGFAFLPTQIDFQMSINVAQRDMLKERGVPEEKLPKVDRESAENWARYSLGGMTLLLAAFPLFVGVVLTSRAKKDEIESWHSLPR